MVKAKPHKVKKLSSSSKRNLIIVALVLLFLGVLVFAKEHNKQKKAEFAEVKAVERFDAEDIGPSHGCKLTGVNYVCDIKINNPSDETLNWTSNIKGIEGATLSNEGSGAVPPNSSTYIQLNVPQVFCNDNPNGEGKVTIHDDKRSSNQDKTDFECQPDDDEAEEPTEKQKSH